MSTCDEFEEWWENEFLPEMDGASYTEKEKAMARAGWMNGSLKRISEAQEQYKARGE